MHIWKKFNAIENRYGRVHLKTKNTKHRKNNINDFENHVCICMCIYVRVCVRILNEFRKKLLLQLQLQRQQQQQNIEPKAAIIRKIKDRKIYKKMKIKNKKYTNNNKYA